MINIYPEYPEEIEVSPKELLEKNYEDEEIQKQEIDNSREFIIKRPTRR